MMMNNSKKNNVNRFAVKNKLKNSALIFALLNTVPGWSGAESQSNVYQFNISSGDMAAALIRFSEATNTELSYPAAMVKDIKSNGLKGDFTAEQALQHLLNGSGLNYRFTADHTVTLEKASKASPPPSNGSTLGVVTVTGKNAYEESDPYNADYNRTHSSTATKTDTPIMQTPMSIKVVPQQVLKDQQVISIDQALKNVSGVVPGAGGNKEFFMRGFGSFNYYRDGFPFVSNWNHTEDLANIDRVEVLKGPGSILYGRADPGGIINFVTKQPLDAPYYSLRQQFGSYDHYRTDIDATGPVAGNKDLSYRANFAYQTNDSITEFAGSERTFAAPMLRWKISEDTVSTIKLEYSNIKSIAENQIPLNTSRTQPVALSRGQSLSDPWSYARDEYVMFSANTTHSFNPNWNLRHRFNASFAQETIRSINAAGAVAANGNVNRSYFVSNVDGNDYMNNFYNSLELTGKFDTSILKHTLLLGGDYMQTDARATMRFLPTPGTNIFNPIHLSQAGAITTHNTFNYSQPWFGIYGQDQIELPYHVHVMGGLRYDNADTGGDSQFGSNGVRTTNAAVTDDRVSPRGGVVWQPIQELSLYGSYSENFGASNGVNNGNPLPPQTAQQWETGAKTELWGGRFTGTLAYYDLKKQNLPMQISQGVSRAVGEAESRGIELDLSGEVLPNWKLIGAYSYMPFAKTLNDAASAGTVGQRLHNAPENSGSLWSTYEFQDETLRGLKLGAGVQAVGSRYIGYTGTAKVPGYATVNLMASQLWRVGKTNVTAQLNLDNLLDKTYYGGLYSYGTALYGAPRTVMGSIKIEY